MANEAYYRVFVFGSSGFIRSLRETIEADWSRQCEVDLVAPVEQLKIVTTGRDMDGAVLELTAISIIPRQLIYLATLSESHDDILVSGYWSDYLRAERGTFAYKSGSLVHESSETYAEEQAWRYEEIAETP